ncbi:MAG TPA: MFS transporter, partial [Alcaligenes faecalis]
GASGFSGAAASTLGVLYMLQAFPRRLLGKALVLGVSITQMATPLAWVLSPSLIELGNWHGLYSFEAGMALCSFAAVVLLKLPPGYQIKAFEKLDFLAFALFAPAAGLLIAFLTQGYIRWWFNDTSLAWMMMASLFLFTVCSFLEYHRVNPLLKVRWLAQGSTIYFAVGAMILRFITTEQNYGMVNMLRSLGMGSEQMQPLFWVVFVGIVCGIVLSAVTFGPKTILVQVFAAILLIGVSSFMDFGRTSLDRPQDFFYSQFVLSVGAGMFMGPLVMIGFKQAFKYGPDHIVTFIVLLNVTQTLGGLMGTATLSTFQQQRQQHHYAAIVSHVNVAEPLVANRLKQQQQAVGSTVTDPMLRAATGTAQLAQIARREASVRAYNDVFLLIGILATGFLLWPVLLAAGPAIQSRRAQAAAGTSSNS